MQILVLIKLNVRDASSSSTFGARPIKTVKKRDKFVLYLMSGTTVKSGGETRLRLITRCLARFGPLWIGS